MLAKARGAETDVRPALAADFAPDCCSGRGIRASQPLGELTGPHLAHVRVNGVGNAPVGCLPNFNRFDVRMHISGESGPHIQTGAPEKANIRVVSTV